MSDLLDSFILEARDLIEAAGQLLLQIEEAPDNAEAMGGLFRAVHTLKGNSGLFPVAPLTRAIHAGEDVLDAARRGDIVLDPVVVDGLFDLFDRVMQWLDVLDAKAVLPDDAEEVSRDLAARLRRALPDGGTPAQVVESAIPDLDEVWAAALPDAARAAADAILARGGVPIGIAYRPAEDCFFRGQDPLRSVLGLPGRVWLSIETTEPLLPSPMFDPYRCVLSFRAVAEAPRAAIEEHFRYVTAEVRLGTLGPATRGHNSPAAGPVVALKASTSRAAVAQMMLDTLVEALDVPGQPEATEGRYRSSARVAAAALVALGREEGPGLGAALTASIASGLPGPLQDAIIARRETNDATPSAAAPIHEPDTPEAPTSVSRQSLSNPGDGTVSAATAAAARTSATPRRTGVLKVDQARIDRLIQLAGELVVAKNALPYLARRAEESGVDRKLVREIKSQHDIFHRIADDLQTATMQVRMVPVATVFDRFRRLVRDLSRQLDKPIDLVIEGEETEADKAIVEDLGDPLVHLVRNACDHGLEPEDERRAAGKPPRGRLRLSARQASDRVLVEVSDDGRGIDVARVRAKVVERGLATAEAVAAMTDDDAMRFVLQPGFSTAAQISDLSGRGVGMDVVNTVVQRCGGHLSLSSRPGRGTTVTVSLPVSMSVRRVMVVDVGDGSYGIALEQVLEMVRVAPDDVHRHAGVSRIALRDGLIPLVDVRRALRLPARTLAGPGTDPVHDGGSLSVVVVETEAGVAGLVVDRFRASAEIIPKPLHGPLSGVGYLTGAALMGDGSVLLLMDPRELVRCPW